MDDFAAEVHGTSVVSVARLWRAQGPEFLATTRAELEADIERLRSEPEPEPETEPETQPDVAIDLSEPVDVRDTIDVRDSPVAHRFCANLKHGPEVATAE